MGIFGNRNDPYKKGNTIFVLWDTGHYYPATVISSVENEVYFKLMGFTDQQWVDKTGTKQAELSCGDMIECRWKKEEKFYQAEIVRVNGNNLYVKYNDGEKEHTTISMIRLVDDAEERALKKIEIGDSFSDKEDYNRAIECYKEALEIKGDCYLTYVSIGLAFASMNKHRDSIEYLKKGLEIEPNSDIMLISLGDSYYAIEEYIEAIKCYIVVAELDEDNQLAHLNLGYSYFKIGKYDESIQYYQTVLDLESNDYNDQAFNGIGDCYYYQSKYRQAIKYFKKAIEVTPDSEHYQNNLKYASDKLAESNTEIG
ncbi:MAG TPA: tetratricopeptide repeat protein, partial [Thermoplasmatales archaeon]|nr:tetratricopeptide repeat protein [Thermoplasmatales archaeon]